MSGVGGVGLLPRAPLHAGPCLAQLLVASLSEVGCLCAGAACSRGVGEAGRHLWGDAIRIGRRRNAVEHPFCISLVHTCVSTHAMRVHACTKCGVIYPGCQICHRAAVRPGLNWGNLEVRNGSPSHFEQLILAMPLALPEVAYRTAAGIGESLTPPCEFLDMYSVKLL